MLAGEACPLGMLPHGTHLPCCGEEVPANEMEKLGWGGDMDTDTHIHTQMPSYPPAPAIPAEVPDL